MAVVSEANRLWELRRLGLSDPVIRLSAGESPHDLFRFRCKAPPWHVYHEAELPNGPPLVPLWDCCDSVTGVWQPNGRLEFIEFSIEAPEEFSILSNTEQGMLVTLFIDLFEDRDDLEPADFREPAHLIGFRFLDELLVAYGKASHGTFEEHWAFRHEVVNRIDQWA